MAKLLQCFWLFFIYKLYVVLEFEAVGVIKKMQKNNGGRTYENLIVEDISKLSLWFSSIFTSNVKRVGNIVGLWLIVRLVLPPMGCELYLCN